MWKPIVGYESNYEVSDRGEIRTLERTVHCRYGFRTVPSKMRKLDETAGYYYVVLFKEGKGRTKLVHRMVAEAFIPNPDNLSCVNHKDGNKKNNAVDNLEWVSKDQNDMHASVNNLRPDWQRYKPVRCIETGQVFASREAAGRNLGMDAGSVLLSIQNKRSYKGYTFTEAPEYATRLFDDDVIK